MEPATLEPYGPGHGVAWAIERLENTKYLAELDLQQASGVWNGRIASDNVLDEVIARLAGINLAIKALEQLTARIHAGEVE